MNFIKFLDAFGIAILLANILFLMFTIVVLSISAMTYI